MNWLKVIAVGRAWKAGQTQLPYMPKDVSIEPTNLCNYRCAFCPQSEPAHQKLPHGFMKLEHLDQILDRVQEAKAAWHNVINFTHDGEPFLHPEFPEMVRRATVRGFRTRFSSNGSKLSPEKLDRLIEVGADFRVSIDFSGSKEIFERYRSRRGDWEVVREHIAYVIEASNRHRGVRAEITEIGGYDRPEEGQRLLAEMQAMLPAAHAGRVKFLVRNFHNAAGLVQLRHANRQGTTYHRCPYPWVSLNIAWNGEVHACPRDLRGQTKLGNILEVNHLDEIWNSPAYRDFRQAHVDQEPQRNAACAGCDLPWRDDKQRWGVRRIYYRLRDW